jgi:hypothetical protein
MHCSCIAGSLQRAVLNPSDSGSGVTISNGNLSAIMTFGFGVRATRSFPAGAWYWEVTMGITTGPVCAPKACAPMIGIANKSASLISLLGSDLFGYGYYGRTGTGQKWNANNPISYGFAYTTGDVIGVLFNTTSGNLAFFKNCASAGVAFSKLRGVFYAAVSGIKSPV